MNFRNAKGFSLLESVLIMVVVGIAFFGFGYLFGNLTQEALKADLTVVAVKLSREKMEEIVQAKADGGSSGYASVVSQGASSVNSGSWQFSRSVNVNYVNPSDMSQSVIDTGYKKVQVTTSWGGSAGEAVTLTTLVTDMVPSEVSGGGGFSPCP
ncbi:MAG TPA: type II secretion system protein [bacterium]|nr:type II secretion system protein [Myxococcales bacterium]OQA61913.1 MAG: hypothetical protein BWY40_00384 [bacterium ADurb.Bin270]HPW45610.1 type II secretion system protein [bacterium]HQG13619.1 type II secretion system protein [bacterium]